MLDVTAEGTWKCSKLKDADVGENSIILSITCAATKKDKIRFTIQTKTTMKEFKRNQFSATRLHEEFVWLHDSFMKNDRYAGILIPPCPVAPNFKGSREKLVILTEEQGSIPSHELARTKQELEAEYLSIFEKAVAMHEVFLTRLASHPLLKSDHDFRVFLEYDKELNIRGKNTGELVAGFFRGVTKTANESLVSLSSLKDPDAIFQSTRIFLSEFHAKMKDSTQTIDTVITAQKKCAISYSRISTFLKDLATFEKTVSFSREAYLNGIIFKTYESLEKVKKLEARSASDLDLKLADLLRYAGQDSQACQDFLCRRSRCVADLEQANKELTRAQVKGKNVHQAEKNQKAVQQRFDLISETAKEELMDFKKRRISTFRQNLIQFGNLQMKHCKTMILTLNHCISSIEQI